MVVLSLITIAFGVPAGATSPFQVVTCRSGSPLSAMVGTSGNCAERRAFIATSALTRPSRIRCASGAGESNTMSIWPAMRSVMAWFMVR
jgi:hypothetical protein